MRKMGGCLTTLEARACLALLPGPSTRSATGRPGLSLTRLQGVGDRRAAARTRHPTSADDPSGDDDGRPVVLGGGEPHPAARPPAIVRYHADHVAPLASALGREAMDAVTSCRPTTHQSRSAGTGPAARERKPTLGISTRRRGAQRTWRRGIGDDGAGMALRDWPRADRHSPGFDLARIHTSASPEPARGRFLHRGDGLAATDIRTVLHRTGQSSCAFRRVHAQSSSSTVSISSRLFASSSIITTAIGPIEP